MADYNPGSITMTSSRDIESNSMNYTVYDSNGSILYQGNDFNKSQQILNQQILETDNTSNNSSSGNSILDTAKSLGSSLFSSPNTNSSSSGSILSNISSGSSISSISTGSNSNYSNSIYDDLKSIDEDPFSSMGQRSVTELFKKSNRSINIYKNIKVVKDYDFVQLDLNNKQDEEQDDDQADEYSLIDPINPTDLILHHENGKNLGNAAKKNDETKKELSDKDPQPPKAENPINTEGIFWPLVNLNGLMLDKESIFALKITIKDFLPHLSLYVEDANKKLRQFNRPSANNFITVILVPPYQGVYKNMVATFYCDLCEEVNEDYLHFEGDYHCIELNNQTSEAIIFDGCEEEYCKRKENNKPTTWEYLHVIAENSGYGFASTENCHIIEDKLPRLRHGQTYLDFIKEHIRFGGTNEDEIFDVWLDLHGTICLVNLPWIFDYDLTFRNLSIKSAYQPKPSDKDLPPSKVKEVHRTITNFNHNIDYMGDLYIENYKEEDNNSNVMKEGLHWTFFGMKPEGSTCKFNGSNMPANNTFTQIDIQSIENSPLGITNLSQYNSSQIVIVKPEYNEYQTERQKILRDNYLRKIRTKYLIVEMKEINFGLERGQLINVSIFAFDPQVKKKLMDSIHNLGLDENGDGMPSQEPFTFDREKAAFDSEMPFPNYYLNGLYYIDYVEIVWDPYNQIFKNPMEGESIKENLKQYLYLIKKDAKLYPSDPGSSPILDPNRFPGLPEEDPTDTSGTTTNN